MASAFANIHEPFLLWRTTDVEAHHVVHLDPWRSDAIITTNEPVERQRVKGGLTGSLDTISFEGSQVSIRGWAADASGSPAVLDGFELDGAAVPGALLETRTRPDVAAALPHVSAEVGFVVRFGLAELTPEQRAAKRFAVRLGPGRLSGAWPRRTAVWAAANPLVVPDVPHLPEAAATRLRELWADATTYLEYGTGGTTMLCARLGGPRIYGVESDRSWLAALNYQLRAAGHAADHMLLHADIGPTGAWGYPVAIPPATAAGDYALAVWQRLAADGRTPQVVLVDGRFRVACFVATLLHADPGTRVLFDDYLDRDHYTVVEQLVPRAAAHDRAVEFVVPTDLDREAAWRLLTRYAGDVR